MPAKSNQNAKKNRIGGLRGQPPAPPAAQSPQPHPRGNQQENEQDGEEVPGDGEDLDGESPLQPPEEMRGVHYHV